MSYNRSRTKLFIENFFAYGAINALNKIIPLLLLPVITRILKDPADFGRFDMFNTLLSFGSNIAILGMYDAMFREYYENEDIEYRKRVTSVAMRIVLISSLSIMMLMIFFRYFFSLVFFGEATTSSSLIVILAAIGLLLQSWRSIIAAPTRMQNKRRIYVVSGLINSTFYYCLAIILIHFGFGYMGLITSNLITSGLLLLFFYILEQKNFNIKINDKKIKSELFKIGVPLVPTFIIYWVFNSMDKIMITNLIDLGQVGIYSIGLRVASVSQFIYMAFAGGWQFFAFSTMKDKDQVELTSKIFEYLGIISFLAFLVASLFSNFIFNLLFTGDYVKGVVVFPYLFLSPLLLMLFQIAGNQFLIIKKSYIVTTSLTVGALANIVLNYFLIKGFGIKGCALATLLGYSVSVLVIIIMANSRGLLKLSLKFYLICLLIITNLLILFFFESNQMIITNIIYIIVIILLYLKNIKEFIFKYNFPNS